MGGKGEKKGVQKSDNISVVLVDGCGSDVRRRARGGGGGAAVSADHRQLSAVQPSQTMALRRPLHQPHQRGAQPSPQSYLLLTFDPMNP